ncbi:MAG: polyribonucleotide nucleotidyltransferase [Fibrobacterota bacterium]
MIHNVSTVIDNKELKIETGKMARQANGAVTVTMGGTTVLVAVTGSRKLKDGQDFFPLTVEYREKTYAAGKIPGGYFKREAKPSEKEILSARIIDRPIRPMFPDDFFNEVLVVAWVISADTKYDADILGLTGASAALMASDIPFAEPVAGARVCITEDGRNIVNPEFTETEEGICELVMAGTEESICMVEGGASEISEEQLLSALNAGHEEIKKLCAVQKELREKCGKDKFEYESVSIPQDIIDRVEKEFSEEIAKTNEIPEKQARTNAQSEIKQKIIESFGEEAEGNESRIGSAVKEVGKKIMRKKIIETGVRIGGRKPDEIRDIWGETGLLNHAHGSALFTRGETQALVAATLGTKLDEQKLDPLQGDVSYKNYMLHYNFPSFSTGESYMKFSTSRREIGHGHLAERSLLPILPTFESFPYTIRIVSDILESNGSSSMASVCGGSLSLMDAGVPVKSAVAGIAMGLIKENEDVVILSDILGDEDHLGDMDFKVTGTEAGITAFQMDIKIKGITHEIMQKALSQAKAGRTHILGKMTEILPKQREELSKYAPRIEYVLVPTDKIGMIIGPSGKNIKALQEETGATIAIDDDGRTQISAVGGTPVLEAKRRIEAMIAEPEVGKVYRAVAKSIMEYGVFVEFMPGKEGLVHISEFNDGDGRIKMADHCKSGDVFNVKLVDIDKRSGKARLSRKQAPQDGDESAGKPEEDAKETTDS